MPTIEPALPSAEGHASSGFGRWLLLLAVAVIVVALVGYKVLSRTASSAQVVAAPIAAAPIATAPSTPDPAPVASAAAAPVAEAPTPAPASSAQPPTGAKVSVLIKSLPTKARFFHFGKQVGVTPFVLELDPGERHAYEVGLTGYTTRKVVVDGSKPEITVGLRKDPH